MSTEYHTTTHIWGNETYTVNFIFPEIGFILEVKNTTRNTLVFKLSSNQNPENLSEDTYSLFEDLDNISSYTHFLDWVMEIIGKEDNNILSTLKSYGKY